MATNKEYILRVLTDVRGDDLERARHAFRGFTPTQMQEPRGQSGKTRAEVLGGLLEQRQRHDQAVAWLQRVPE